MYFVIAVPYIILGCISNKDKGKNPRHRPQMRQMQHKSNENILKYSAVLLVMHKYIWITVLLSGYRKSVTECGSIMASSPLCREYPRLSAFKLKTIQFLNHSPLSKSIQILHITTSTESLHTPEHQRRRKECGTHYRHTRQCHDTLGTKSRMGIGTTQHQF